MNPIKFDEATNNLAPGDNPNTGDLPIAYGKDPSIQREIGTITPCFLLSCWELTDEEFAAIAATRKVWLGVMASPVRPTQAPVFLSGFHPFQALNMVQKTKEELDNEYKSELSENMGSIARAVKDTDNAVDDAIKTMEQ